MEGDMMGGGSGEREREREREEMKVGVGRWNLMVRNGSILLRISVL